MPVPDWSGAAWQEEVRSLATQLLQRPCRKLRKGQTDLEEVQGELSGAIDALLEEALGVRELLAEQRARFVGER